MECSCYLRNIQDILSDGKTSYERRWSGHGIQVATDPAAWHTQGEGRINVLSWYRLVGVAKPPVSRKGGRTELPARVSGRHVVRRRQSSPIPAQEPAVFRRQQEVRQGNRQGWWKRSTFREKKGRQLTLDKTVGSRVWWHTQGFSEWKVSVRSKVGIVCKKSR